jgi:hypothetical protein
MVDSFAYGLHLRSNLPIPGLPPSEPQAIVDVEISLGEPIDDATDLSSYERQHVSPFGNRHGEPLVVVSSSKDAGGYLWQYWDGQRFLLDATGHRIRADWPASLTMDDVALNLLGPILGFVLRLRGFTCLHASAVAVGGEVLAFVGRRSAGKSTTAAALALLGYPLVSEDVVPVLERGGGYEAIPGYPSVRLWPRSVDTLYGADAALPLLTRSMDKRRLDVDQQGYAFQTSPLPLAAVYYLSKRRSYDPPHMESVPRRRALMMLVTDTYTNYALDKEMRAREFALLGRLTMDLPFRFVTPNKDPRKVADMCRLILDDFRRLKDQPPMAPRTAGVTEER